MYRVNTRRSAKDTWLATMTVVGIFWGVLALAVGPLSTQGAQGQGDASLNVGTYDIQAAFEQHPAQKELQQAMDSIQKKAQDAQKNGGGADIQGLQQQYEQKRTQLVQQFHREVEQAIPAAAKASGVDVVAAEISYSSDKVNVKDITPEIVERLKKDAGDQSGTPQGMPPQGVPQFPPPQQE